jgi:hypothetical protein
LVALGCLVVGVSDVAKFKGIQRILDLSRIDLWADCHERDEESGQYQLFQQAYSSSGLEISSISSCLNQGSSENGVYLCRYLDVLLENYRKFDTIKVILVKVRET